MSEKKSTVKPITQKRLMNIALYYLGRYESSAENLRRLLSRRIKRAQAKGADIPVETQSWINFVINEAVRLGYIDDRRYAASIVKKYRSSGKSQKYIRQKLMLAGVASELQDEVLTEQEEINTELDAAFLLVKKRKLGIFRPEEERSLFRKKDLAVLARAGFSYQTAVKALGETMDEENENVWD